MAEDIDGCQLNFVGCAQVLEVVEAVGKLDGDRLRKAQEWFSSQNWQRKFMLLRLVDPQHRSGQPDQLNQVYPSIWQYSC